MKKIFLLVIGVVAISFTQVQSQMQTTISAGCKWTVQANLDVSQWQIASSDTVIELVTDQTPFWSEFNPVLRDTVGFYGGDFFPDVVSARQWPYVPPTTVDKIPFIGVQCPSDSSPRFISEIPSKFQNLPVISIITDTGSLFGPEGIYNDGDGFLPIHGGATEYYDTLFFTTNDICVGVIGQNICFDKHTKQAIAVLPWGTFDLVLLNLDTINQKIIIGGLSTYPYIPNYYSTNSVVTDVLGLPRSRIEKEMVLTMHGINDTVHNKTASFLIAGNSGSAYAQKGFQLRFRNTSLKVDDLLGVDTPNKYKTLNLRCGGSGSTWARLHHTCSNRLARMAGLHAPADRPVHLFINGEYWGLYNSEERMNKHSYESQSGTDSDSIVDIGDEFADTTLFFIPEKINTLQDSIAFGMINKESMYQNIDSLDHYIIDVRYFLTYLFHHCYLRNSDWSRNTHNRKVIFDMVNKKIVYMVIDQDGCFDTWHGVEPYDSLLYGNQTVEYNHTTSLLVRRLLNSPKGLHLHLNHSCDLMNTVYRTDSILSIVNQAYDQYSPYIKTFNVDRWGMHSVQPQDLDWQHQQVIDFVNTRERVFRDLLLDRYSVIDGEARVSIQIPPDTTIGNFHGSKGYVKLSTLKLKQDFNGVYFTGIPIPVEAVAYPGFKFSHWLENGDTARMLDLFLVRDTMLTPVFEPVGFSPQLPLQINEIMVKGEDYVELYNPNQHPVLLDQYFITDSLNRLRTFPSGAIADTGYTHFLVEPLGFKLDKEGETVYLVSSGFNIIDSVSWVDNEIPVAKSKGRSCLLSGEFGIVNQTPGLVNDTCFIVNINDVSNTIKVYPNPTTGILNITGAIGTVTITDLQGKQVFKSIENTFDISELPAGMYFLNLPNGEKRKIVKQ
jgi:hypothetical protein